MWKLGRDGRPQGSFQILPSLNRCLHGGFQELPVKPCLLGLIFPGKKRWRIAAAAFVADGAVGRLGPV